MIGSLYLIVISAACAAMGIFLLAKRARFFFSAKRSDGNVVRWEARGLREPYHYPVVRFSVENGNTYEFIGGPGFSRPSAVKSCVVLYAPDNPRAAMVGGILAFWAAPVIFLALAGVAGFAALVRMFPSILSL